MENELQMIREQEIEACLIELRGQKGTVGQGCGNAVWSGDKTGE